MKGYNGRRVAILLFPGKIGHALYPKMIPLFLLRNKNSSCALQHGKVLLAACPPLPPAVRLAASSLKSTHAEFFFSKPKKSRGSYLGRAAQDQKHPGNSRSAKRFSGMYPPIPRHPSDSGLPHERFGKHFWKERLRIERSLFSCNRREPFSEACSSGPGA